MDAPHAEYPFLEVSDHEGSIGQIGIYIIHRLLGDGASSVVFKGWDPKLERWVAVRVLKPHLAKVPTARTRFLAENRAGSSVVHPNVLSVYEVHDHDEWPYAILAYNDGETLADLCESGHEFTLEEVCQIGLAMAKGLDAIIQTDHKGCDGFGPQIHFKCLFGHGFTPCAATDYCDGFGIKKAV